MTSAESGWSLARKLLNNWKRLVDRRVVALKRPACTMTAACLGARAHSCSQAELPQPTRM